MNTLLKTSFIIVLSWNSLALAGNENPLSDLRVNLESTLIANESRHSLSELKTVASQRNVDIEVAFQNYIIAKKRVSVARAAFNPLTTGHLLGLAIGLNYLWAPIAIEAVTSIPTKIYNVSANKYLARAALYNSYQAKLVLNNELAHLYYDILTHEVMLKTIDEELTLLSFHEGALVEVNNNEVQKRETKTRMLALQVERIDIYNLYNEELAGLRTLLTMGPGNDFELSQIAAQINRSFLEGLNSSKLQDFALQNSHEYKKAINVRYAAETNIKTMKWSILSFSGMNSSYRMRVKNSKVTAEIAQYEQQGTKLKVRNTVLVKLNNLESSLNILENYSTNYDQSMGLSEDYYRLYNTGLESEGAAIETAISAVRDFRNRVVAHYISWSALDDFSTAVNFNFKYANGVDTAQVQIEKTATKNPVIDNSPEFIVVRKSNSDTAMTLKIESDRITSVSKVEYIFDNNTFESQVSTRDTKDFYAVFAKKASSSEVVTGVARILMYNGQTFEIKFQL
jgi:hypothetical protein